MSKIERALRKAEEERRARLSATPPPPEHMEQMLPPVVQLEKNASPPPIGKVAESFRKIAARIKLCCETMGVRDVLFTSAISEEGKTTAAANCAISLSQDFNLSVCLVDCDLRNPQLAVFFGSVEGPGLVNVLKGETSVVAAIQPTAVPNLSVVHCQRIGRSALRLLNSDRLGVLVSELRSRFDFVIFDSPPILPVADAVVLAKKVSAMVLLIEPGRTRRKHVEQILEQVDRNRIAGFIMNYKQYRVPQTYNYSKYYNYDGNWETQAALQKE